METVIATSNEAKYHATEGGSQLHQKEFIDKLGTYGDGSNLKMYYMVIFSTQLVALETLKSS